MIALAPALVGLCLQQSPAPSPTPLSFSTAASIVRIDVVASDKRKKVVSDLRPEDFEISFAGKRITPSLAQFIPAVGSEWVTASPTDATAPTGRAIAFITAFPFIQGVGGGSNLDRSMEMVQRSSAMLDAVIPRQKVADRIAIVLGDEVTPFLQFSGDPKTLKSQAKRIGAVWLDALKRPIMVSGQDRDAMLAYGTRFVELTEHVIRALSEYRGRRMLFIVSDAFPNGYPRPEANPVLLARVRALTDMANRHRVTMFGINPAGLGSGALESLEFIAERTGGQTIQNTSRLKENLIEVFAANEGHYLVGFEPGVEILTFPQKIKVRALRKGVEVRARSEIVAEDLAPSPKDR